MNTAHSSLEANHRAVNQLLAHAQTVPEDRWEQPVREGKWSARQIVEHVAISYELATGVIDGTSTMKAMPRFLRPVIRGLMLKPMLKKDRMMKGAKAPAIFQPGADPVGREQLFERVTAANDSFESAVRRAADAGQESTDHPIFGTLALADYVHLNDLHTRHHQAQIPEISSAAMA